MPNTAGQHPAPIYGPRLCVWPCLDFANTLAGRGETGVESLHNLDDLAAWCRASGFLSQSEAERLQAWSHQNPVQAFSTFSEAITLREAIYGVFGRIASGRSIEDRHLEHLNRALMEAPPRHAITRTDGSFSWHVDRDFSIAPSLLAPVVWSAGDLLTGRYLGRVRLCANHRCLWLFFDDSLRGARRWCSMQACGNRAKTQRHYLRRKAQ